MSFYIEGPVTSDANILKQRALDYLITYMPPGFKVASGDVVDLLCEAFALQAAEQADVANAMLDSAFRYFGGLVNVPPIDSTPATSQCTYTVQDTAGYTIPAGTVVGIQDASGTLQGFDLIADLVVAGGLSTATGTVQAEQPGASVNGLSGTAQVIQAPAFVTAASLAAAVNGVDAELDSVYLGRLSETLTLLSPRPVLAPDFAILARSVAGVFRAAAVDLLKPGPPYDITAEATNQEKNVTVAVTDINGNPVGATIRATVQALLQSYREQNFKVWAVDPQYVAVDVAATVYAWPGWDTTDVHARVVAALQALLSPANYGADASGNAARWANDPILRPGLIQQTIYSVPGVRYTDPQPTFGVQILAPPAPTPTQTATGGTVAAGTYGVIVTYTNASGETVGSAAGSVTTSGATSKITVPSPPAAAAVTGWYAYVTQAGGSTYTRQQTAGSPTAIGTALNITAPPSSSGANPPGTNTAEVLASADVTLGAGSSIPALPTSGTLTITVLPTT